MTIVVLSDEHKKDISYLSEVDLSIVDKFCELTMSFLRKGEEAKKTMFTAAAKKLEVQTKVVESAVTALGYLFVKAAKLNLSLQEFTDSLAVLAFDEDKNKSLLKTYEDNKVALRNLQSDIDFELPHFTDLRWRLDVQLATRSCRDQVNPLFVMQLDTKDAQGEVQTTVLQTDFLNLKHLASELQNALDTANQVYFRRVGRNI